jgi:hypothetical protein
LANPLGAPLFFSGPGAGPDVTAATILDDVSVAVLGGTGSARRGALRAAAVAGFPEQSWFIRITPGASTVDDREAAQLLGSFGVWLRRTSDRGRGSRWLLTSPCADGAVPQALDALRFGLGCEAVAFPVLEGDAASEQ